MKQKLFAMGIISLLSGLFGCSDSKMESQTTTQETIDLDSILFTTPTLESGLPLFTDKTDSCVYFHEDEWRQIEFISKDQKNAIDKEMAKIRDIHDNHTHKSESYTAFRKVALRDLIPRPLSIDFSKLTSYLTDQAIKTKGLGLENNSGQVKGGFYFSVNGINYYGLLENNTVKAFCIYSADSEESLKSATTNLSKLLANENLYLVDWRAMSLFDETTIKTDLVKDIE